MAYKIGYNNFSVYKADFKKDTGKDCDSALLEYISYYNARVNDTNSQINTAIIKEINITRDSIATVGADIRSLIEILKKK